MRDMDKMALAVAVAYVCYRHPALVVAVAEGLKNAEKAKALPQDSAAQEHAAEKAKQADLVVKSTIAARFLRLFGLVHVRSLSDARKAELGG